VRWGEEVAFEKTAPQEIKSLEAVEQRLEIDRGRKETESPVEEYSKKGRLC